MILRKPLRIAGALSLLVAGLSACYESDEPLGPSDRGRLDKRLIGTWDCRPPEKDAEDRAVLSVSALDEKQYDAEWREDDDIAKYRAYSTEVEAETLLNVTDGSGKVSKRRWIFLRYGFPDGGGLVLSIVREEALEELEGGAALEAIRHRVKEKDLYGDIALCTSAP